jgi:hypothetical protein
MFFFFETQGSFRSCQQHEECWLSSLGIDPLGWIGCMHVLHASGAGTIQAAQAAPAEWRRVLPVWQQSFCFLHGC